MSSPKQNADTSLPTTALSVMSASIALTPSSQFTSPYGYAV
jgi:hypothetical protein